MHILRTPTIAFVLVSLLAGCGKNLAVRVTPPGTKTDASTAAKVSSADMPVVVELNKDAGTAISAGALKRYSTIDDDELETGKEAKLPKIEVGKKGDGDLEPSTDLFHASYVDTLSLEKFNFKNIYKFRGFFAMPAEEAIESVTSVKLVLYGLKKYLPAGKTAGLNSEQIICLVDVSQCNGEKPRSGALPAMKLVGGGEFAKIPLKKEYAPFAEGSSLIGQEPGNDALSQNGKVEIELTEYFPDLKTVKGLLAASKVYADPDLRKMRFVVADGVYFESGGLDVQFKIKADKVDANLGQVWNGPKAGVKDRSKKDPSPESARMANGKAGKKKADPAPIEEKQVTDQGKKDPGKVLTGEEILAAEKAAKEAEEKAPADQASDQAAAARAAAEAAAAAKLKTELSAADVPVLQSIPPTVPAVEATAPTPLSIKQADVLFQSAEVKTKTILTFKSKESGLTKGSNQAMAGYLALLKPYSDKIDVIAILGFADQVRAKKNGEQRNLKLSQNRALSVAKLVLKAGFPVKTAGMGEVKNSLCDAGTEGSRCGTAGTSCYDMPNSVACKFDRYTAIGVDLKDSLPAEERLKLKAELEEIAKKSFGPENTF